jgi:hypothetical protein
LKCGDIPETVLDDPEALVKLCLKIADESSERAALVLCNEVRHQCFDIGREDRLAALMLAEAILYDTLGKGMSRDLHAVEAAEAFYFQKRYALASRALALVAD